MVVAASVHEGGYTRGGWLAIGLVALLGAFFTGSIAAYQTGFADVSHRLATDMDSSSLVEAFTYFMPLSMQYREAATLYGGITGVLALIAAGAFMRATR
jgi:hypothetical protein